MEMFGILVIQQLTASKTPLLEKNGAGGNLYLRAHRLAAHK